MKTFKYTATANANLKQNGRHQFAMNHTMMLYKSNALYTFIPKNACSTMRLSLAFENGCIDNIAQGHWIHSNNNTFVATLGEAIRADYRFVILRCPFRRLASAFLDKIVSKKPDAWQYRTQRNRSIELDNLTFHDFVNSIKQPHIRNGNIHWRPQTDFLAFESYSDYFSLERFGEAIQTLENKIGLQVRDARELTKHGIEKLEKLSNEDYSKRSAFDISVIKRNGQCPSHESLYTPELIEIVKNSYLEDFKLYTEHFQDSDLLFSFKTECKTKM